jgi:endonuclease/exonuclease/phosphatase (EEP) superfamily protein YafD
MFDKRELRGFLTAVAGVAALMVLLASAPYVLPGQPLLQTLRLHVAGGTLVVAIALLVVGARWRGILLALLAFVSLGEAAYWIGMQQSSRIAMTPHSETPRFSLVSYNVLIWNDRAVELADELLARDADVVFTFESGGIYSELPRLRERYPYKLGCDVEAVCDTMILSKTPIEGTVGSLGDFSRGRLIVADAQLAGRDVNLVAVHMTKPYFDLAAEGESWALRRVLEGLDGPVIVAGDFNAAPWSGNMRRLLRDTGLMPSPWYPPTWPAPFGPLGVPIDNVFTRAPALVEEIEAIPDPLGSNHRGLEVLIQFPDWINRVPT